MDFKKNGKDITKNALLYHLNLISESGLLYAHITDHLKRLDDISKCNREFEWIQKMGE